MKILRRGRTTLIIGILISTVLIIYLISYKIRNCPSDVPRSIITTNNQITSIRETVNCYDKPLEFSIKQYEKYWVFKNFVQAARRYKCDKSVTFTTIGDYLHADNLIVIVERWKGPVSVAFHASGEDFFATLRSIAYLRNCQSLAFKKFVTFHIVIDSDHIPKNIPLYNIYADQFNCSEAAPYENVSRTNLYKTKHKITYPINILRNIARESAQTHFVLAADIELYPSLNVIPNFLKMVTKKRDLFNSNSRSVFVLPPFEVRLNETVPMDKTSLVEMYNKKKAIMFHQLACPLCHKIPKLKEWLKLDVKEGLNLFVVTKRTFQYRLWEPFYIGTNDDPFFEERIHWENGRSKMDQNYMQCLLDYDYWILDNAFLVHRPGIKIFSKAHPDTRHKPTVYNSQRLRTGYNAIYGKRKGC
ncbi:hypothetical protein RI129_012457 [Pyrocoelia pectoralis]|uniref:N-acetyllactosaminide beta-1,3-N-acetylglucosaminyltransferase n=1 Tax=Pyrocoelia pectoralis TaxID=417401 RepID=A0AAN7ZC43_9COLE